MTVPPTEAPPTGAPVRGVPAGDRPADGAPAGRSGVPPTGAAPGTGAVPRRRFRLRYAVVGAVLAGALVFLLAEGLGSSLNYYIPVAQAVHQRATLGASHFRLEGVVEPGTVHDTGHGVDFTVTGGGVAVAVVATGSPPQLFQPNIPVVLDGHFAGATFAADQIIVKHTSQYIAAHPNRVRAPNGSVR